jgi:tripeptidyl-peptidase II
VRFSEKSIFLQSLRELIMSGWSANGDSGTLSDTMWKGLLPKNETEAMSFVKSFPQYNGRDIVVGILDTGVDPGAPGLQVCPDGRPKIVNVIDCTGSGDVHMSSYIRSSKSNGKTTLVVTNSTLTGPKERVLTLNSAWTCPSGEYRYGQKSAFELYPRGLKDKVKSRRKVKWMKDFKAKEHELQHLLAVAKGHIVDESITDKSSLSVEDLSAQMVQLVSLESTLPDPGPVYDCLCWYDGSTYQAAVDTSEKGDFSNVPCMADYKEQRCVLSR